MKNEEIKIIDSILEILRNGETRLYDNNLMPTDIEGFSFTREQYDFIEPFLKMPVITKVGQFEIHSILNQGSYFVTVNGKERVVSKLIHTDTLIGLLETLKLFRHRFKYSDAIKQEVTG